MKAVLLACASAVLVAFAQTPASAADLDDDDIVYERPSHRVIVRERIIIREYVAPRRHIADDDYDDDDDRVVVVRRGPSRHHHYVGDDDWPGPRIVHRNYGWQAYDYHPYRRRWRHD